MLPSLLGAAEGLSFTVTAAPLHTSRLPEGGLRKNAKAVPLPYGLGVLGHKQAAALLTCTRFHRNSSGLDNRIHLSATLLLLSVHPTSYPSYHSLPLSTTSLPTPSSHPPPSPSCQPIELQCKLSATSTKLLRAAVSGDGEGGGTRSAAAFAGLLARLSVDSIEQVTAANCTAFAPAIRGDAADETDETVQSKGGGRGGKVPLAEATVSAAVPTRCRGIYLPPGQPGAASVDLGVAEWIGTLRGLEWVPTSRGLVRPAEATFRPPAAADPAEAHLGQIELPSEILEQFSRCAPLRLDTPCLLHKARFVASAHYV